MFSSKCSINVQSFKDMLPTFEPEYIHLLYTSVLNNNDNKQT